MQIVDPNLKVRSIDTGNEVVLAMHPFRLTVYGGLPDRPAGYFEYFEANAELSYTGLNEAHNVNYLKRDGFQSMVDLPNPHPRAFQLMIPALIVDGAKVESIRVLFKYVEKKYTIACVQ